MQRYNYLQEESHYGSSCYMQETLPYSIADNNKNTKYRCNVSKKSNMVSSKSGGYTHR